MEFTTVTPQQRERMRLLNTAMMMAEEGLMKRALIKANNKPQEFDALRSNWDVWVRLSDQDRVLWQAINAVKQQIKGTWTDEDEDEN
jgi:hypothetical protein